MLSKCLNFLTCCKNRETVINFEYVDNQIANKSTNPYKESITATLKSSNERSIHKNSNSLSSYLIENETIKCPNSPDKLNYLRGQTMSFKKGSSNQSIFTFNNCKTEKFASLKTIINETSQKLDFFNETKIKKLKVNIYQHNEIFTIDHKGGEIVIKNPSLGYSGHSGMSNKLIKIFYDEEQKKYFAKCDKFPLHIKIFSHIKLDPGKRFVFNLGKEPIEIKIIQSNDIEIKTINGTHKFSKDDVPIRVGRHNSNSVYLEDQSVSKIHAIIEKVEDSLIFRDNKSTNGSDWIIHVGELYQISTLNVFSFGDDNYIRIDEFDEN